MTEAQIKARGEQLENARALSITFLYPFGGWDMEFAAVRGLIRGFMGLVSPWWRLVKLEDTQSKGQRAVRLVVART